MAKAHKNKPLFIFTGIIAFLCLVILLYKGGLLLFNFNGNTQTNEKLNPSTKSSYENVNDNTIDTSTSNKTRLTILVYTVQPSDTVDLVAKKFGISSQTIMWANNLNSQTLTSGQKLQILPVTSVAHKVVAGDTVSSLATKYHTDQQKIIDFPGNNFSNPETQSLIVGETLIIPDGSM